MSFSCPNFRYQFNCRSTFVAPARRLVTRRYMQGWRASPIGATWEQLVGSVFDAQYLTVSDLLTWHVRLQPKAMWLVSCRRLTIQMVTVKCWLWVLRWHILPLNICMAYFWLKQQNESLGQYFQLCWQMLKYVYILISLVNILIYLKMCQLLI